MKRVLGRIFKRPKNIKSLLRSLGLVSLWLIVLGAIVFFSFFIYLERTLPDPETIAVRKISESTKIYDRTGQVVLYDIHGEEKRTVIPWEHISQDIKDATLAAEDANFYNHGGFDVKGILRALYKDLRGLDFSQGGSTITQQLVKKALLSDEKSPTRKLKELVLAIEIERRFSKDQILWMYLNQIPYGSNAYGIQSASKTFFGKDASQVTLNEAAVLAALPNAPTRYSPYGNNIDLLMARKNMILDRMEELGYISQSEHSAAVAEKLTFKKSVENITAPHFVLMVKDYLVKKYGEDAVESSGFKVITTLDTTLQEYAEETVSKYSPINKQRYRASNASLVSVSPKNGDVLALVGSADYFDVANEGNFNIATTRRQPGSAFKPFAYASALQKGYPDSTVLFDLKTEFNPYCSPDGLQGKDRYGLDCYHPRNYDGLFRGPVSLRQALAQSLNIPSVKTLYLAGIPDTIELAKNMGITTLTEPNRYGLSLVLGGAEVRPIDLASAYGVFGNDGVRNPWRIVLRIEDVNGNVLEEAKDQPQRVMDSQVARLMTNILSDNSARAPVFGYNNSLYIPGYEVAAKTGTTQENRDGWVAGYSPSIATVVWNGNNKNTPMTAAGAGISASGPMWHEFMTRALASFPRESFIQPDPVSSNKVMLNGSYAYMNSNGSTEVHEILRYVDRNDPLGPFPANPAQDPQYANWDWPVMGIFAPSPTPEPTPDGYLSPTPQPTL